MMIIMIYYYLGTFALYSFLLVNKSSSVAEMGDRARAQSKVG